MERVDVMLTDRGEVEVPESLRPQFEEEARTAGVGFRAARRVSVGGQVLAVAEEDREAFEKETAESGAAWEPVHTVRAGEETVQVPQSLAGEFLKEYRAAPQFDGERKAAALKTAERMETLNAQRSTLNAQRKAVEVVRDAAESAGAGAANMFRGIGSAPLTLADKALAGAGFVTRGVEALYGEAGKSGFREAVEGARARLDRWREENMGFRDEEGRAAGPEDWGVTFGGQVANAVAEVYLAKGAGLALGGAKGAAAGGTAAGGRAAAALKALRPGPLSVLYGLSRGEQTAGAAEEAGRGKGEQVALGAVTGAWEAAVESLSQVFGLQESAGAALGGAVARGMRRAALAMVGEGAEEGAQSAGGAAVEKLAGLDGRTWAQIGRDAAVEAAMGLAAAGVSEAGMGISALSGERQALREALAGSTGAAAEAERAAAGRGTDGGDGNAQRSTFNSQRSTGETEGGRYGKDGTEGAEPAAGAGGAGGEGAAAAQDIYGAGAGEEVAGGAGGVVAPARADGARAEGVEVRQLGGRPVRGVRLLMPDGRALWTADPGEVALAEYWLKDRMLFPPSPAGDRGRQAGDPAVNAARRAGFELKPGKSVLVELGRSKRPYPATVVDVLDDGHVRLRVKIGTRSVKNNRAGYADVDVRQVRQWAGAAAKQKINERLARLGKEERAGVLAGARRFKELLLEGDELLDQEALAAADALTGQEGGVARTAEMRKAYARAAAALDVEADLNDPVEQARALPALEAWLERARGGEETPEAVWLERAAGETEAERDRLEGVPLRFDSMTADEMIAEERRVAAAAERVERRRELERRAAAGISGTAGDMTGTLPGMEGTSDVPLFTEQGLGDGGRMTEGGVLANEEPGTTAARLATPGAQPGSVGGVRVTPHTVYNQDGSAGMEGEGRTVAPVADGLQGVGMDLRDAVSLYRELRGLVPRIRKSLNGRALGWYKVEGREIELLASIFGLVDSRDAAVIRERLAHKGLTPEEVEAQVPAEINALVEIRRNSRMKMPVKVLTHELGHLVDALPDGMLRGRGNILGHVAALHRYMKQTLPRAPGEAGEVSGEEKARLWSEAEKMAERDLGKAREWVEEIRAEVKGLERVPVSAEDIKGILGLDGRERTPELYAWFARQDDGTKKDILKKAMKGLVDERAEGGAVREVLRTVVTGTRIRTEKTYSRADVSKRFRELLRKAVEDLRLIERDAIVAEARAAIPLWRGVEAAEKYFERPEEMYAELFGMFLSDPGWMEKNVPTAFRAYVAYMDVRPDAAKAYRLWLNDRQNGTAEKKHVDRLKEAWAARAEDDLAKLEHLRKKATAAQEWQGFRYFLDRRMGPVYAATRTLARLARTDIARRVAAGETDRGAAGAELAALERRTDGIAAGVKDVLHHQNTIRLMLADVRGRVSGPLRDAGLDWTQLAEFAFHNRVRYELDGRAAAFGWAPETSGRRLEEMRAGMTEAQWEALGGAWLEFRGIYERAVVEMDGMREMLGEELHDLIRKNVHYVAFAHVPTAEEVRMTLEEREAAGADAKAAGLREYDGVTAFDLVAAEMERRGGAAGAKIYALTGSFDPVADPLTATLEKAGRMVNAVYQNRLKLALRDFARDTPGSGYREAETGTRKGGEKYLREVDDGRFKTLHYMEGGELKAFVTDKWVAEAFEGGRGDRLAAVGTLMKANNLISAMYTRLRIGFFEPAYMKDKQAVVANMKGLWRSPLASVPFLGETPLAFVTRYIPEGLRDRLPAWLMNRHMLEWYEGQARRVAILIERGDFDAQLRRAQEVEGAGNRRAAERMRAEVYWARRALGMNVLMAMQDVILPGQGLSAYERMNAKHGVRLDRETAAAEGFLAKHGKGMATAFVEWYARLGEIRENTTKIAALMYLDETSDMSEEQKKVAVSEFGGSPDFSERGVAAGYFEFMQGAFINARKEGLVRSFKAAAANPGDYVAKKMVYSVTPAAVRWMVGSGFLLGLLRAAVPEEEREGNPVFGFLEWAMRKMSFVSDYLQKSYAVIPLPVDAGENCAVVLTLPMDETERAWNDLTCSALDSLTEALGGDVSKDPDPWLNAAGRVFGEFLPFAANGGPMLSAIMPWLNTYGLGRPTYDSFRQRNVLTDDELAARYSRPDAVQALLGNTWNALGGGTVKAWERDKPQVNKMVPVEEFLRWPVIQPVVGRFVRVVRNGQEQIVKTIGADEEAARITDRLDAKRILVESMKQGVPLLPEYRERVTSNPYILDYYFEAYEKQFGKAVKDPFLEAAAKSSSPETAMRLMRKRSELGL